MEAYFGLDYEIKLKISPLFYNYDILCKNPTLYKFDFYLIIDNYEMKVKIMRYKVKNYCIK